MAVRGWLGPIGMIMVGFGSIGILVNQFCGQSFLLHYLQKIVSNKEFLQMEIYEFFLVFLFSFLAWRPAAASLALPPTPLTVTRSVTGNYTTRAVGGYQPTGSSASLEGYRGYMSPTGSVAV